MESLGCKRKAGITFNLDSTFAYAGHEIPEKELFDLADTVNKTQLFKMGLAQVWLNRRKLSQHTTTQHNTTQHNTTSPEQ